MTIQTADLLIELSTEELPPKALRKLSESFTQTVVEQLRNGNLLMSESTPTSFATPRRLGVLVSHVLTKQPDEHVERKGPAISAAFDAEGNPTKAALGWARGQGIEIKDAGRISTDKGEWLVYNAHVEGKPITQLLPQFVAQAAKSLPVPKMMRWGDGAYSFIRPLKHLTVLLNETVVPMELFGVKSDRVVLGHRFHGERTLSIKQANSYAEQLRNSFVVADFTARRDLVKQATLEKAKALDAEPVWDEDLLDEVASLVEYPVAMQASFETGFLSVPKEALIYTMKDDQRYFPLVNQKGDLLPQFIFISNIDSRNPQAVIEGNEKVIRPRLSDAQFFFETDKKERLESRVAKLDSILFQKKLGTVGDKARRLEAVAIEIASLIGGDSKIAGRAGLLAKADLVSNMVTEFPEVQGIMGMHYALHDGEGEAVATAIEAHYHPRFAGDSLPASPEGAAVALADKLDTLVGIFAIGQTPKGDKDPFALRRAAIGLLRILIEGEYQVALDRLIDAASASYKDTIEVTDAVKGDILEFLLGRFRAYYQEQSVSVDVIQAVLARKPLVPFDFEQRVKAVQQFKHHEAAESLAAANKRVGNILSKVENGIVVSDVKAELVTQQEEKDLVAALAQVKSTIAPLVAKGDYQAVLTALAALQAPIDAFFDNVMVNAEQEEVRLNRLAILNSLRNEFLQVADIGLLQS